MDSFDEAVDRLRRLPGIGEKSARRLVLHLVSIADSEVEKLARSLIDVNKSLGRCERCHSLAEDSLCGICQDPDRSSRKICVVDGPETVFRLENAGDFNGRYHVLGGLISPLEGVGPEQLTINGLIRRISGENEDVREVIFAFNPTNEGEVTMNYLREKLASFDVRMTHLSYGVPVGSDLEYTDRMTLSKAFQNRVKLTGDADR